MYPVDVEGLLAPGLYRRLQRLFGDVGVANRGGRARLQVSRGYNGRPRTRLTPGGEYYRVNCPYCGDTRQRLWISYLYGQPDSSGRPMSFLAHCFNEDCLADSDNLRHLYDRIYGPGRRAEPLSALATERRSAGTNIRPVELPTSVVPMDVLYRYQPDHQAVRYLLSRGYEPQWFTDYSIGYCVYGGERFSMASERIIFPVYDRGALVGWQARKIEDRQPGPKYYNMPGFSKSRYLYASDLVGDAGYVVLVEGVVDVHKIGPPAVSPFGKTLSEEQIRRLLEMRVQSVVVMLDADAGDAIVRVSQAVRAAGMWPLVVTLPPGTDPGNLSRQDNWALICEKLSHG